MNRDHYWHTRGVLAGIVAALILIAIGTVAGAVGGYLGGSIAIGVAVGQGAVAALVAVTWVVEVWALVRLPESVRDAFNTPHTPPHIGYPEHPPE